MSERFTVLGGRGFVGSAVVARVTADGADVYVPARGASLRAALGHVVYAVGLTSDFASRPFDTVRAHVALLADVLERASFDSFVYLSSARAYRRMNGLSEVTEEDDLPVAPAEPGSLYDLSKLAGEALCHACGRDGVRVVRLSNVYGRGMSPTFVSAMIVSALGGELVLREDIASARDYVHVDDVAALLPEIARRGRRSVYNVASGAPVRNRLLVELLQRETGCAVRELFGPYRSDPEIRIDRVVEEFGFAPRSFVDELPALVREIRGDG